MRTQYALSCNVTSSIDNQLIWSIFHHLEILTQPTSTHLKLKKSTLAAYDVRLFGHEYDSVYLPYHHNHNHCPGGLLCVTKCQENNGLIHISKARQFFKMIYYTFVYLKGKKYLRYDIKLDFFNLFKLVQLKQKL